jgi:hypothetical protein
MKLFRKRDVGNHQTSTWLLQLRDGIERKQRKAAEYLGRRTQYWNRRSWLIALVLFVILFGSCCLLLCIKAFIHL